MSKKKIKFIEGPSRYTVTYKYNRPGAGYRFKKFHSEEECQKFLAKLMKEHDSGKNPLRFVSIKAIQNIWFEEE